MERRKKMKARIKHWTLLMVSLVVCIGGIGFFWHISKPYEVSKKIWLPENYSIVNLVDNEYITKMTHVEPSGTLMWLTPGAYKQKFSGAKTSVAIQENGVVNYIAKVKGETWASKRDYGEPPHSLTKGNKVVEIIGDGTIKLHVDRNWNSFLLASILLIIVVSLVCFLELSPRSFWKK